MSIELSKIPLGRAHFLASTASREIRAALPVDDVVTVGGIRRFAPEVSRAALLVVAAASKHQKILKDLHGLQHAARVSVHLTVPEHAGAALLSHTGSRRHLKAFCRRAARFGLALRGGVLRRGASPILTPTEEDCYGAVELPHIPPELRQTGHEIDFASTNRLPELVGPHHIRGDLHMHSTWSDGRDAIADMVSAAVELGYEYVAITDHSERAICARKLAAGDVDKQREEIDSVRNRYPGIDVMHGVEVDIMHDGTLDFDDDLLAQFDIVLASLHDHAGHDGRRLTSRYLSAIHHPLVSVITHPANRAPGVSNGYDVDFDRLFEAAVSSGTALEIDGAPGHLDLDGRLARRAARAGVTLTIDSDAHRSEWLRRQMRFGIGTARRGWVEPHLVLNTRPRDQVREFITRKRTNAPRFA